MDIVFFQMKPLGAITHEIDCSTFLHNFNWQCTSKEPFNKSEQNLSLKIFAIVVINNYFLLKRIIIYE